MKDICFLSHITQPGDPGWPGNPTLTVKPYSQIARGDIANTYQLELFNHFGTHMDAPNHFNGDGVPLSQLPASAFVFSHPYLLDQPLEDDELLTDAHLRAHDLRDVDCLLIRSGFERWRRVDPVRYAEHGPGVSSQAARYLMEYCPGVRIIILDWISISAYQKRPDGYLAHQILAGAQGGTRFILGVEDASLAELHARPDWVMAWPLRIVGTDGGPCTVVAGWGNLAH